MKEENTKMESDVKTLMKNIKTDTTFVCTYFPNGSKCSEMYLVNWQLNGEYIRWWQDQEIPFCKTNYVDGKMHGKYTDWFTNGIIWTNGQYVHGLKDGKWNTWYDNAVLHSETIWDMGRLMKETIWYSVVGRKSSYLEWYEFEKFGKKIVWDWFGRKTNEWILIHGRQFHPLHLIFKRAKWYRLARLTKTKAFNEWWYSPEAPGGKIAKKRLERFVGEITK